MRRDLFRQAWKNKRMTALVIIKSWWFDNQFPTTRFTATSAAANSKNKKSPVRRTHTHVDIPRPVVDKLKRTYARIRSQTHSSLVGVKITMSQN